MWLASSTSNHQKSWFCTTPRLKKSIRKIPQPLFLNQGWLRRHEHQNLSDFFFDCCRDFYQPIVRTDWGTSRTVTRDLLEWKIPLRSQIFPADKMTDRKNFRNQLFRSINKWKVISLNGKTSYKNSKLKRLSFKNAFWNQQ